MTLRQLEKKIQDIKREVVALQALYAGGLQCQAHTKRYYYNRMARLLNRQGYLMAVQDLLLRQEHCTERCLAACGISCFRVGGRLYLLEEPSKEIAFTPADKR